MSHTINSIKTSSLIFFLFSLIRLKQKQKPKTLHNIQKALNTTFIFNLFTNLKNYERIRKRNATNS